LDNQVQIQLEPEAAEPQNMTPFSLAAKRKEPYDQAFTTSAAIKQEQISSEVDNYARPNGTVRVFSYVGTPSNRIGQNGDFYLEEETNTLYGPKIKGVWPEDGSKVIASIIRRGKRDAQPTWSIDFNDVRESMNLRKEKTLRKVILKTVPYLFSTLLCSTKTLLRVLMNELN